MTLRPRITAVLSAVALAGCAGSGAQLPSLPAVSGLQTVSNITVGSLGADPSSQPLSSSEVYSRIALGANACWFGPRGRLGKTHLMHADVAPSPNGGAAELVVHERAVDQPKPWGFKAFRVVLSETAGASTSIGVENSRIADAEARRMTREVYHWAAGKTDCIADPELDQPVAAPAAQPAPSAPVQKAARKKT